MPQPPLLLIGQKHSGVQWLYQILANGLQFERAQTNEHDYKANHIYFTYDTIDQPFKLVNLAVIVRDPRDICVMAAKLTTDDSVSFKRKLKQLLKTGGDETWNQMYLNHYRDVSHWRFRFEELIQNPISLYDFLMHYHYHYHADLIRQSYYDHDCMNCMIEHTHVCGDKMEVFSKLFPRWQDYLTEEQNQKFILDHEDIMALWGYI